MEPGPILIVDDKEENRYYLSVLLTGYGYKTIAAVNGVDALEKARQNTPILIIADILMPAMDGFTLCREWKKDEKLRHIPFVMYTATYTDPQDEMFAYKIGADRFVVKPCEPEALLGIIREVLLQAEKGNVASAAQVPENEVFRLYSERLVQKLERKMLQVEEESLAREKTELALRESEKRHRQLFETMPQGVVFQDLEGKIVYANPAAEKILGLKSELMLGRTSEDPRWRSIHEDGSEFPGDTHPAMVALRTGQLIKDVVMGVYNPLYDQRRWIKISAVPLFRPGEEKPYQVYTTFEDITDYKQLQAQFLQSQKMEAVGVLAGGVAHDFNNLLTVIRGYAEILLENLAPNNPLRGDVEQILHAGKQAASLTAQLLAFSRKQMLQPKTLLLNAIINDLGKMLGRLLGEDIDLVLRIQSDLGLIHADPGQIQQVIMNLVVNARDAMPRGGTLIIETSNSDLNEEDVRKYPFVKPGAYVMLSIRDNGMGMDAATQARIFEPFYTTKAPGEGTGLGLSTVYGIVRQSGGFIWLDSEPNKGTTFRIYFPRLEGQAVLLTDEQDMEPASGGGETILVVEDDVSVRALACRILRGRGYTVMEASNGKDALAAVRACTQQIDLVITDVVMPEMSGAELASQLEAVRPGIRILYVSGYANRGMESQAKLDPRVAFLQKPFTIQQLVRKGQSVLNE
jgi:PAS domain S-box-containing protein